LYQDWLLASFEKYNHPSVCRWFFGLWIVVGISKSITFVLDPFFVPNTAPKITTTTLASKMMPGVIVVACTGVGVAVVPGVSLTPV
jgi:hypothetical protein